MKIILTGITSFRNHGVEALVVSAIAQLQQRLPQATFVVLDREPDFDRSRMPHEQVRFAQDYTIRPLYAGRLRKTLTRAVPSLDRYAETARAEIASATCVIASGGDVFASEYGHHSLLTHLAPLKVALKHGKPVFFAAHSIGPFKNEADSQAFLSVAQAATHITVRERMTFDYVIGKLGLPQDQVTLTADPAFLLNRTEAPWREHFRFTDGRPLVALSTSQAICNWMGSDYANHFRAWCDVVEWLRAELDANLVLIPHVQELSSKNDDRILATELVRHFRFDPHLQIAGGDFSASDFKGIISQCDLVVAERMHAAIAGLSSAVPTVVIGYSVKGEGILTDLLGQETVQRSVLLTLKEFLEGKTPRERIASAWKDRGKIRARLEEQMPETKRRAAATFDIIAARLQGSSGATR